MPSTTTYYGLAIYNASSGDETENFLDYRTAMAGVSAASNMSLIDDAMNDNAVAIAALEARKNIIAVAATLDAPNTYLATVASIVSYDTDQVIALKLDTDSNGTVTLNINSLGSKSIMKVSSAGAYVNLDGSDMRAEREYNCKYDGTRYVWMDATSADQINIEGTSGNFAMINSDNELEDSLFSPLAYSTASVTTGNVTLVEGETIDLTISGMTADRDANLPTPSAAGVLCGLRVITAAPALYELVVKANSVELTRLLISGEILVYRSTGTGAGDWVLETDGKIPCVALGERTSAQTISTATVSKLLLDTSAIDRGGLLDTSSNYRIDIRRDGLYSTETYGSLTSIGADKKMSVSLYLNTVQEYSAQMQTPVITTIRDGRGKILSLSAGDYIELYMFHDHGSDRDTGTGVNVPSISVSEIL